jgi:hypothetical protein
VRTRFVVPLALGFVLAASRSSADPMLRYTWGPANGMVVNQDFAGPATYTQTFSVIGLSGTVSHIAVQFVHSYQSFGTAWKAISPPVFTFVSPPQSDCRGGPGFTVTTAVAGAAQIPNALATVQDFCTQGLTNPTIGCHTTIDIAIDPPIVADPAERYGILTLEYHHQNSVTGFPANGCDNAEGAMCWVQVGGSATINGGSVNLASEGGILSWQNGLGTVDCLRAVTPTQKSSWGSIKTLYR